MKNGRRKSTNQSPEDAKQTTTMKHADLTGFVLLLQTESRKAGAAASKRGATFSHRWRPRTEEAAGQHGRGLVTHTPIPSNEVNNNAANRKQLRGQRSA